MKLFKTRTSIFYVVALVLSAGTAALLKPWWDRRRKRSEQAQAPAPAPATSSPPLWPVPPVTTWNVDPLSTVHVISGGEITAASEIADRAAEPRSTTRESSGKSSVTKQRVGVLVSLMLVLSFASSAIAKPFWSHMPWRPPTWSFGHSTPAPASTDKIADAETGTTDTSAADTVAPDALTADPVAPDAVTAGSMTAATTTPAAPTGRHGYRHHGHDHAFAVTSTTTTDPAATDTATDPPATDTTTDPATTDTTAITNTNTTATTSTNATTTDTPATDTNTTPAAIGTTLTATATTPTTTGTAPTTTATTPTTTHTTPTTTATTASTTPTATGTTPTDTGTTTTRTTPTETIATTTDTTPTATNTTTGAKTSPQTTTTATTSTPAVTNTTPAVTNTSPAPNGPTGSYSLIFDDEFNGTSLNSNAWVDHNGYVNQNNVTDSSSNMAIGNGDLTLTLANATSGESIETKTAALNVGDYAEARIDFAGNGTNIYNWPAFWAAGPSWPASGEQDVFEGLGSATVNYHYAVNGNNTQAGPFDIPGTWSNGFHTYGVYRGSNYCNVYWDGKLVKSYSTDDNSGPEYLILEMGASNTLAFGTQGQMVVDYVREWQQS